MVWGLSTNKMARKVLLLRVVLKLRNTILTVMSFLGPPNLNYTWDSSEQCMHICSWMCVFLHPTNINTLAYTHACSYMLKTKNCLCRPGTGAMQAAEFSLSFAVVLPQHLSFVHPVKSPKFLTLAGVRTSEFLQPWQGNYF